MLSKNYYLGWLLCLVPTVSAQAPLTVTPSHLNYRMYSPNNYPGGRFLAPPKRILSLRVPDGVLFPWTVSVTGSLTTSCLFFSSCFQLTEEFSSRPIAGSSGSRRIAINWYGQQPLNQNPGIYSAVVIFAPAGGGPSAAVTIQMEVLPPTLGSPEPLGTAPGTVTGCSNAEASLFYTYPVRCLIPDEAPIADSQLTALGVGQAETDPVFGGKLRRITGPGCSTEYGTTTAFSAQGTYIFNTCGVYRTANGALVRAKANLPGSIDYTTMSAVDDESFIYMIGTQIRRFNWNRNSDVLLGNFGGAPYNFQQLYAGGTAGASDDEWISFFEYSGGDYPKICATDLIALAAAGAPGPSNTYCATYSGTIPLTQLDWTGVSEVDGPSGKRFVFLSAVPLNMVFSVGEVGSGQLRQEYIVPEWPGWTRNNDDGTCAKSELCYNASSFTHISLFRDRDGQINLFGNFQDILAVRYLASTYRLNGMRDILRPEHEGGGQRMLGRHEWDRQPGCSPRLQGCTIASIETGLRFAARVTAAASAETKTTITLSAAPGWPVNVARAVRVQNAPGAWSCLNGGWSATPISADQLEIPTVCAGSGSLGDTMLGDATQPFSGSQNDNRGQIQVWLPGRQVHRVAMHRSVTWVDVPGTRISAYDTTPRASLSRDGRYVAFSSNRGALDVEGSSVYVVETGLGNPVERIALKSLQPSLSQAVLAYDLPSGRACAVTVSGDVTFQNAVDQFVDAAGPVSRVTYLGRGAPLQPDTPYWVRIQCGMEVETGSFRTLPAAPVTAQPLVTAVGPPDNPSVATALMEYRLAGEPLWEATAPESCATGCTLFWTGSAGRISEYRIVYRNSVDETIYRSVESNIVAPTP